MVYYSNAGGAIGSIGSSGCGNLAPAGGWINDESANGCWKVLGPTIPLGPQFASEQAADEIVNAAFTVFATTRSLPNYAGLPGNMNLTRS